MEWVLLSIRWYLPLLFLGIIAYPAAKKIFRIFPDNGYAFGKTITILFISYSSLVLGGLKILPFTQSAIIFLAVIFGFINLGLFLNSKKKSHKQSLKPFVIPLIIFEELLFFIAFLFWTYIRSQEPSIRSLEKFMDFGFINSILRSTYFPPKDIWYPPYPINYYYFGHLVGATLIKLTNIKSAIGYNLLLATIFALGITQSFSLIIGIAYKYMKDVLKTTIDFFRFIKIVCIGLLGSFIVNLGGNLHTIYLFTKGYPNENPVPFWEIISTYNPAKYWYPNATRFIPFTIHEFPSYSYVVADLHGHVFDIPFVLLTIAILFIIFIQISSRVTRDKFQIIFPVFLGFLTAIHYMTNAFDGPIYLLLTLLILFILFKLTLRWFFYSILLLSSFIAFSLPFSRFFSPFVNGIGINCSPQFLIKIGKIGPFLFEKGNCQISSLWMLFILWGFFWINFLLFAFIQLITKKDSLHINQRLQYTFDLFIFILFAFGLFLTVIPEFFYIKDIYPAHFRANTMFKLGYQAFMIMSIASAYTFFRIKLLPKMQSVILSFVFIIFFSLIAIYPLFSIPSYYGRLTQKPILDGSKWIEDQYPEDKEMIDYLNTNEPEQPTILEAQGDSYTDFERISAMTGLPTVAGWWVHEWLWRGSSDIIAKRIPDVVNLYESNNMQLTKNLLQKYHIKYIVIGRMEKQKYKNLNEKKFTILGKPIFRSTNRFGALYQVKQ